MPFGAWHVSEFCFDKLSPFFTSAWRYLFSLVIFLDSTYHFGEIWTPFQEVLSAPAVENTGDGPMTPLSQVSPTGSSQFCSWPSLSQFYQTGCWCAALSHIPPPALPGTFAVFLPAPAAAAPLALALVGLLRVRMEAPCSGWVWWAYCCVSKCSLKAETEDIWGIELIPASN